MFVIPYSHHSVLFFFLRPPLPPRSTLFPYTTLFRSLESLEHRRGDSRRRLASPPPLDLELEGRGDRRHVVRYADRKSTRLNSSHQIISYAVFCLKKKKKKKKKQHRTDITQIYNV